MTEWEGGQGESSTRSGVSAGGAPSLLSIVIPLYNEAAHFETTLPVLLQHCEALPVPFELVLVDDGSSDATWEHIQRHCTMHPNSAGYRLSRNFGKEGAISAGLRRARGDAVVVMDGDLQHPPELLAQMYALWREGRADVVEAVRTGSQGQSALRAWGSRCFNKTYTLLTGYDLSDATDFKLLDRRVVDEFLRLGETRTFYRGMVAWLGFRHVGVPFAAPRGAREGSVWSLRGLAQYATTALTSFTSAPLHLVTLLGFFTLFLSILLGIEVLYRWFDGTSAVGFPTVIVVQLFGNSIVMLSLGVIGEYIGSIYQESKRRPRYIICEEAGAVPAARGDVVYR